MNDLVLKMVTANSTKKEDIITALCDIALCDFDFSGANGEEYLWEIAEKNGYESNLDYVSDNIKSDYFTQVISEFLDMWLGNDDYYDSYEWNWTSVTDGKIVIAITYIHIS